MNVLNRLGKYGYCHVDCIWCYKGFLLKDLQDHKKRCTQTTLDKNL